MRILRKFLHNYLIMCHLIFVVLKLETYRYPDPLYIPKISTESISIFSFIYVIDFLIQNPEINKISIARVNCVTLH